MDSSASNGARPSVSGRMQHLGIDPSGWLFAALIPVAMVCVDPSQIPTGGYVLAVALGCIALVRRGKNQRKGDGNV